MYLRCRDDVYDCGIFTYRGSARYGGDSNRKRYVCVFLEFHEMIHSKLLRLLLLFAYIHTFEIGAQLKPKRCLCDFGELPKLIRVAQHQLEFGNASCDNKSKI